MLLRERSLDSHKQWNQYWHEYAHDEAAGDADGDDLCTMKFAQHGEGEVHGGGAGIAD